MTLLLRLGIGSFLVWGLAQSVPAETPLEVLTFNIRYGTARDEGHLWEDRKEAVAEVFLAHSPDLFGLQEALDFQIDYLSQALMGRYIFVGEGRDGGNQSEFSAVGFRSDRFRLARSGRFWLSETPDAIGSHSWAGLPRMVTWCELVEKATDKRLVFANTHFAHDSEQAREKSAHLIGSEFSRICEATGTKILCGDFNCTPASAPHRTLTGSEAPAAFRDVQQALGKPLQETFNGFRETVEPGAPIDWILFQGDLEPKEYEVLDKAYKGRIPSDHFPVRASFSWRP